MLTVLDVEEGDVVGDERVESVDRDKLFRQTVRRAIVVNVGPRDAGDNLGLVVADSSKDMPQLITSVNYACNTWGHRLTLSPKSPHQLAFIPICSAGCFKIPGVHSTV